MTSTKEHTNDDTSRSTEEAWDAAVVACLSGSREWSTIPPAKRARRVRSLRRIIADRQDFIARAIVVDTRKPITEALNQEVTATLGVLDDESSRYPTLLRGYRFQYVRPGFWTKSHRVVREPIGVIAVIGPSNFPFSLPVMQTAAALLCGNTVVLKPSEHAPRTAEEIARIFKTWDPEEKIVRVLNGDTSTAEFIVSHPAVKKVIFTGGREGGANIARLCALAMKTCVLELGGNAAAIVCEDADLDLAARGIVWSAFYAGGRSCVGTKRLFVDDRVADRLVEKIKKCIGDLTDGDPLDPSTDLNANPGQIEGSSLSRMIEEAASRGASIWTLSGKSNSSDPEVLAGPTLILDVHLHSSIMYDEIPSRVLCVRSVASDDQAISETNESPYGLSASVWSRSRSRSRAIASRIDAGMVWINDASSGEPRFPWGGTKSSGWGRLYSDEGILELTNTKVISHDHRLTSRSKLWWFPYTKAKYRIFRMANKFLGR